MIKSIALELRTQMNLNTFSQDEIDYIDLGYYVDIATYMLNSAEALGMLPPTIISNSGLAILDKGKWEDENNIRDIRK